jgi:4-carboxymuconolactone decarboxylase
MDRMPPIAPEAMTPAQKAASQQFRAKRGVDIDGPFVPLLRSPGLLEPLHQVGIHCRYNNALGLHLSEFIILNVARRFNQSVEWAIHAPIAEKAGVTPETIAALLEGHRPSAMTADEAIVYDAIREIWDGHCWSDTTFAAIQTRFGDVGVIDLVGTVGYYTTLALVMNATQTAAPGGYRMPSLR